MSVISHGQARRIASEWHGGQASALYSLASAGYVDREDRALDEIDSDRKAVADAPENYDDPQRADLDLRALRRYVVGRGFPTYVGLPWHKRWDETPATEADAAEEVA